MNALKCYSKFLILLLCLIVIHPCIALGEASTDIKVRESTDMILLTLNDISCRYLDSPDWDFSQELILDSFIPGGELLLEQAELEVDRETSFLIAEMKSSEKYVIIERIKSATNSSYVKLRQQLLADLFNEMSITDLSFSIFFAYKNGLHHSRRELLIKIWDLLKGRLNRIDDEKHYNIYYVGKHEKSGKIYKLRGIDLQSLFLVSESKSDAMKFHDDFLRLQEEIAQNDSIPYDIRHNYIVQYINSYFNIRSEDEYNVAEYLEFLVKIVKTCAFMPLSTIDNGIEIDQYAVMCAETEYYYQNIDVNAMISFCDTVIAFSLNPKCILQAYGVKTQCFLELERLDEAQILAIEALNLYEESFPNYTVGNTTFLNAKAAGYYLEYLLKIGYDVKQMKKVIKKLRKQVVSNPEFDNYLLYIKAVQTDFTNCPVEETIKAYKRVDQEAPSNSYLAKRYDRDYHFYFVNVAKEHIKQLSEEIDEIVTINKPFIARDYLISDKQKIMNETGEMAVKIIQHSLPLYEKPFLSSKTRKKRSYRNRMLTSTITIGENKDWQKAEINNEIYWIKILYEGEYKELKPGASH